MLLIIIANSNTSSHGLAFLKQSCYNNAKYKPKLFLILTTSIYKIDTIYKLTLTPFIVAFYS